MRGVPLEWIAGPGLFAEQRGDWERLRAADPEATFFHTARYLRLYAEGFLEDPPQVAVVTQGGEPIGMCAFEVRERLLSFLGGFEVTDYMGPVGRPSDRTRVAKELMTGLAARDDWSRADLEGLPENGSWLGALAEAAEAAGLSIEIAGDDVAPVIELPAAWDTYLSDLRSKHRHEIRRKDRRLRERFRGARLTRSSVETLDADLDRFVAMHRASEGPKGRFMEEGMESFFRRLGRELLPDGLFRLEFLEAGGEKLAGLVAFRFEGSVLLYNSAYDPEHAAVAPGMVLVAEIVKEAIGEGCSRIDMLKGDLGYKYRFGARPRPIRRLLLERP